MKSLRSIAFYVMMAAGMVAGKPAFATDPPPTPIAESPVPTNAAVDPRLKDPIAAIDRAADPSAVVEAYGRGLVIDPNSVALKDAYVKRLVSLGVPELAETQARDLTGRRPDLGLPWAVVGYMDARRGSTKAALEDILLAAGRAPDEPFVQRTAGQLLGYYDLHASRLDIDTGLKESLNDVRKALNDKPAFTHAYQKAKDEYAQAPANAPGDDSSAAANATPVEPYANTEPSAIYNYNYNTYERPYTDPYTYDYAAYPWWPSYWWWGPGAVIIDDPFRFHHRFEFEHRFNHGRFDHGDGRRGVASFRFDGSSRFTPSRSFSEQRSFASPRSVTPSSSARMSSAPRFAPSIRSSPGVSRSFGGSTGARQSLGSTRSFSGSRSFGGGRSMGGGSHAGGGGHR